MTMFLVQRSWGRCCLHVVTMIRDHKVKWHVAGIKREFAHA